MTEIYEADENEHRRPGGVRRIYQTTHLAEVFAELHTPIDRKYRFRTAPVWGLTNGRVIFVVDPNEMENLDEDAETQRLRVMTVQDLPAAKRALLGFA